MAAKLANNRGKGPGSAATQFKDSGNRKGRPKGSKNRQSIISKVLDQVVSAEIGGRRRRIPVTEASLLRLSHMAIGGDRNAIKDIMILWKENDDAMHADLEAQYPISEVDRQVIEDIYARMKACKEEPGS